jgi:homoserine kinase
MLKIKAPASSANLGPGFDCLGLSLDLYNTFEVETCNQDILENVEDRFNNADNLFLRAYHYGMEKIGKEDGIHAIFHCDIPVSRGLGSSAAMIVAGYVLPVHCMRMP